MPCTFDHRAVSALENGSPAASRIGLGWWRLAGRARRELARIRSFPVRRQMAMAGPYLFLGPRVQFVNAKRMRFGNSVTVRRDAVLTCDGRGRLQIGNDVHISQGCVIACGAGELMIGDHTIIGEYTSIRNADHGTARGQLIREQPQECRSIRVGQDVWIGRGCAILPGVTVGDGAVIGANTVVTKDIEPYAVVAGVPARRIRFRV